MTIPINEELKDICKEIVAENLSLEEWSHIESDDMFQTKTFEGGFDATAKEFVFSFFAEKEYWFQLSLADVIKINNKQLVVIIGTIAED